MRKRETRRAGLPHSPLTFYATIGLLIVLTTSTILMHRKAFKGVSVPSNFTGGYRWKAPPRFYILIMNFYCNLHFFFITPIQIKRIIFPGRPQHRQAVCNNILILQYTDFHFRLYVFFFHYLKLLSQIKNCQRHNHMLRYSNDRAP